MKTKSLFIFSLLLAFCFLPLYAANISVMVIETGLNEDIERDTYQNIWESSLLDVFFDAGHIVSNAPGMRLMEKPRKEFPDEARVDLAEAVEGGIEYFIVAMLDYPDVFNSVQLDPSRQGMLRPENVSLKLYRTSPYKFLYEEKHSAATDRARLTLGDEISQFKQTARGLISHLNDR